LKTLLDRVEDIGYGGDGFIDEIIDGGVNAVAGAMFYAGCGSICNIGSTGY